MSYDKAALQFVNAIVKLNPIEFIGVSKILCVPMVNTEKEARQFDDILSDMIDNFIKLNRRNKRELLQILKLSAKVTDDDIMKQYAEWETSKDESK